MTPEMFQSKMTVIGFLALGVVALFLILEYGGDAVRRGRKAISRRAPQD